MNQSMINILFFASDTDECNMNTTEQLCSENAFCINTIGSYLCRCNVGFEGNGFSLCQGNFHL